MPPRPDSPSRRGFLAATALPLIVPSIALADAPSHPDAALTALGIQAETLLDVADAAAERFTAAEEMCCEATGPVPVKPREIDRLVGSAYREALHRYEADHASYVARVIQIEARVGLEALNDAMVEADAPVQAALKALTKMRATTLEGLTAKARVVGRWRDTTLLDSIVDDLLAMGDVA